MLLEDASHDTVMLSPLQPTTRLQTMLWAPPQNVKTTESNEMCTVDTKGQLKLVLCATSTKLTLTVLGLRSLPQSCLSRDSPTYVYLKVSLYPDQDNRIRHKTDVMPVSKDAVTLHDSFSFNIGRKESCRRLLISAWCRHENRYSGASTFIGCMSFGIRKLVAKQEVMQGWYYFLSESLGRKKHLTSKHICEDKYPENSFRSSTLHVRTVNIYPSDESSSTNDTSRSVSRDRLNLGLQTNQQLRRYGKKRVSGDLPVTSKRPKLSRQEHGSNVTRQHHSELKPEPHHFTVGMAVGKRSSEVMKNGSQHFRHTSGHTPTGRRHVRRKSYSSTDLSVLHEAYRSQYTAAYCVDENSTKMGGEELRNATALTTETSTAKIVKQPHASRQNDNFVIASHVSNRSSNATRRRKLNDAQAPTKRSVSCYGNPELELFPENVIEQVTRDLCKAKNAGPKSHDFPDVGYHSETTSTSSACSTSSDMDSTSSSSEEECHQVAKVVEARPVSFAKNLPTISVKKRATDAVAGVVGNESRKTGTIHNLKTWFNRKPDAIVDQPQQRKVATPTKSMSTGWLFRYKSAADHAISRQLKRSNSLRHDYKRSCDYCSFSSKQLAEVLKNKAAVEAFRAFLKGEYSEENLDFWLECETYKTSKPNRRHKMANKIFERFIQSGSPNEINIDNETRKATQEGILSAGGDTFSDAQQRIFDLMSRDSFRRFQMSELRKCKCRQIG